MTHQNSTREAYSDLGVNKSAEAAEPYRHVDAPKSDNAASEIQIYSISIQTPTAKPND